MNSMLMFQFAMIGFSIKHSDVPSLFVCKNQRENQITPPFGDWMLISLLPTLQPLPW